MTDFMMIPSVEDFSMQPDARTESGGAQEKSPGAPPGLVIRERTDSRRGLSRLLCTRDSLEQQKTDADQHSGSDPRHHLPREAAGDGDDQRRLPARAAIRRCLNFVTAA